MLHDLTNIEAVEIVNLKNGLLKLESLDQTLQRGARITLERNSLRIAVCEELEKLIVEEDIAIVTIKYTPIQKTVTAEVLSVVELPKEDPKASKKEESTKRKAVTRKSTKVKKKKKDDK